MPDSGTREVEMNQENENVRGFIKYVLKTLRHVAFAAFKSTMAVASPLILLVSVWYQSVEVGAYLFVSMLAVWVVLTGLVTIKEVDRKAGTHDQPGRAWNNNHRK